MLIQHASALPKRKVSALLSLWIVLGLALTSLTAPPARAQSEDSGVSTISEGQLTWGVKESFRNYLEGGAAVGSITISDGVTRNDDGEFQFPLINGTYDPTTRRTEIQFGGHVAFYGHAGAIDRELYNPRLVIDSAGSSLFADTVVRDQGDTPIEQSDVEFVSLDHPSGTFSFEENTNKSTWSDIPTSLTEPALSFFLNYYEGQELDPVSFSYTGIGASPVVEREEWTTPGTIRYKASETPEYEAVTPLGLSTDGEFIFGQNGKTISVYKQSDLSKVAETELADDGGSSWKATFDAGSNTVFYRQNRSRNDYPLRALKFESDGTFSDSIIAETTGINSPILRIEAVTDRDGSPEVVAWTNSSPRTLSKFKKTADGTWDKKSINITDLIPAQEVNGDTTTTHSVSIGVAGNGDIIYSEVVTETKRTTLEDGTFKIENTPTVKPIKVLDIETAQFTEIPDSVQQTTQNDVLTGWNTILPTRNGGALLSYTGRTTGNTTPILILAADGSGNLSVQAPETSLGYAVNAFTTNAYNEQTNSLVTQGYGTDGLAISVNGKTVATAADTDLAALSSGVINSDGIVFALSRERNNVSSKIALRRFELHFSPSVITQPENAVAYVNEGTATAQFTVESEATPTATIQWQTRPAGSTSIHDWTTINNATNTTLSVTITEAEIGAQYRAILTNDAGSIATQPARTIAAVAPTVALQPTSTTVTEHTNAVIRAVFTGTPAPETVTWQRFDNGFWTDITTNPSTTIINEEGMTSLTIHNTNLDQTGTRLRAIATNPSGTTITREAVLTVRPATDIPDDGLNLDDVVLRWGFNAEVQTKPPFGTSNYLSAGISDGSAATYRTSDGDVTIIHTDGTTVTEPNYATRATHIDNADVEQLVEFGGGDAIINPDGSATIDWDGSVSINFYDGLVPFTITNPHLEVSTAGTGVLTGDLTGYAVEMSDPDNKQPLEGVYNDVVIATFTGVSIDPSGIVTITPDYDGVIIDVPVGVAPQVTAGSGWGSWPQGFVDFHFDTNLSSYWYSSGGVGDVKKTPLTFDIDFTTTNPGEPGSPQASDLNDGNKGSLSVAATAITGEQVIIGGLTPGELVDVVLLPTLHSFDQKTVEADGTVTITIPAGFTGVNQVAVYKQGQAGAHNVLGWSTITITDDPGDSTPPSGSTISSLFALIGGFISKLVSGLSALFGLLLGGVSSS